MQDTGGVGLIQTSNGSIQRMIHVAKKKGWNEIAFDCRETLQRKVVK